MTISGICSLLSCAISVSAFVYGVIKVFKKRGPMYFKLIVAAVGCYMLEELCALTAHLCGSLDEKATVGMLAIMGSVFFLLSANYGQLDGLVDEGHVPRSIKAVSCIVPFLLLCSFFSMILLGLYRDLLSKIVFAAAILPMLPASYLNMKHLLMKDDEVGFLKSAKGCNLCALLYYIALHISTFSAVTGSEILFNLLRVSVSVVAFALAVSAERGSKHWKISISSFS